METVIEMNKVSKVFHGKRAVEDIADRILLFSRGALVADGSPERLGESIVRATG